MKDVVHWTLLETVQDLQALHNSSSRGCSKAFHSAVSPYLPGHFVRRGEEGRFQCGFVQDGNRVKRCKQKNQKNKEWKNGGEREDVGRSREKKIIMDVEEELQ